MTVALSWTCDAQLAPPGATPLLDVFSTEMPGAGHCRLVPGRCWEADAVLLSQVDLLR